MVRQIVGTITVALLGVAGCRGSGDGKEPLTPKRVESDSSADATASFGMATKDNIPQLVLGLPDRNAGQEPAVDAAIIDSCVDFLPEDFVVGEAKCVAKSNKTTPLTAGMFKQTCYLQDSEPKEAAQKLKLDCEEAQLFLYSFDPPLRAEVQ